MLCKSLAALAVASLASAATPAGFTPGSNTDLIVSYNGVLALNGAVEAQASTQTMPSIGTTQQLTGSSYAVLMIDIDIPTNTPPTTSTLLHWMQTGLTPATTATNLNASTGSTSVFLLENTTNTAPFASYLGPNPPARIPLSHRYVQILVDTSNAQQNGLTALQTAAANRSAFSAESTLTAAGLQNNVVAGNFFNVTNGGTTSTNGTTSTGTATGTSSGTATGTGATTGNGTTTTSAAGRTAQSLTALALFVGAMLVL